MFCGSHCSLPTLLQGLLNPTGPQPHVQPQRPQHYPPGSLGPSFLIVSGLLSPRICSSLFRGCSLFLVSSQRPPGSLCLQVEGAAGIPTMRSVLLLSPHTLTADRYGFPRAGVGLVLCTPEPSSGLA
jgi:hypothetical protein